MPILANSKQELEVKKEKNRKKVQQKMNADTEIHQYTLRVPNRLFIKFRQKLLLENKRVQTVLVDFIKQYAENK